MDMDNVTQMGIKDITLPFENLGHGYGFDGPNFFFKTFWINEIIVIYIPFNIFYVEKQGKKKKTYMKLWAW